MFVFSCISFIRRCFISHLIQHDDGLLVGGSGAGRKIEGSLQDLESLVEATKQVEIVICATPSKIVLDQKLPIQAIKEAGCIKRFIPSEFGADPDKARIPDLDYGFYAKKSAIRRVIGKEGIPYTYISCNFFTRYLLPSLAKPGLNTPPRDRVKIFGDGNTKDFFELPDTCRGLYYCNILSGVIRGALEMEFMIFPVGASTCKEAMKMGVKSISPFEGAVTGQYRQMWGCIISVIEACYLRDQRHNYVSLSKSPN